MFVDESGFLLIPNGRRTWAPKGQRPCLPHRYRHDRLSVCSGLAVSPTRRRVALYLRCRAHNFTGLAIEAFLRHLLRHLRGPIDWLWDRGPIHRRLEVTAFLAAHPDSMGTTSPRTRRNSIPRSTCGRRLTMNSPMAGRLISGSSAIAWPMRRADSVARRISCGPASTRRIFRGPDSSFHYLRRILKDLRSSRMSTESLQAPTCARCWYPS